MQPFQPLYVGIALARLRRGVNVCCWIVACSLLAQVLVWGFATFMDVRYSELEEHHTRLIVEGNAAQNDAPSRAAAWRPAVGSTDAADVGDIEPANPNLVITKYDRIMHIASTLARGAGSLAMVVLLPLLAVGVILTAGSATPGVERVVSSFIWSTVVAIFVLPVGSALGLPWDEGALATYGHITTNVDNVLGPQGDGWGGPTFYARFVLLPLACVMGVILVGFRFNYGVEAGIPPKESMRLDPVLEREAANMKATSLYGSRTASAMRTLVNKPAEPADSKSNSTSMKTSAGEMPRRLI